MFSGWGGRHEEGLCQNRMTMNNQSISRLTSLLRGVYHDDEEEDYDENTRLTGLLRSTQQVRGTARPVVGDH